MKNRANLQAGSRWRSLGRVLETVSVRRQRRVRAQVCALSDRMTPGRQMWFRAGKLSLNPGNALWNDWLDHVLISYGHTSLAGMRGLTSTESPRSE